MRDFPTSNGEVTQGGVASGRGKVIEKGAILFMSWTFQVI